MATNFGSHDCIAIPGSSYSSCISIGNNYNHQWHFTNPRNDIYLDFLHIVNTQYDDRTELVVTGTTFSNADVQVFDADYGDFNVWGWVWCPPTSWTSGSHPYKACRPQWLRFNLYYLTAFDTQLERRYMACHEFGHTLGLRHTSDTASCMKANVALVTTLTTHDISHINAVYWPY
jgi:hypothetical protein